MKKHEELMKMYNDDIFNLKTKHDQEMRDLRAEYDILDESREALFQELNRFLGMPNPCGVGMALVEEKSKNAQGQPEKCVVVQGMQPGLAADLSGVIRVKDVLLQVNEFLTDDMSLPEVQAKVAGNRGTQVAFRFRRKIEDGESAGETFDYRIVLKRGAWGPEHCVMTPEDLDMINEGRWPRKGAVSTDDVNMDDVTAGVDVSLNYASKGTEDLGLTTKSGRPASAAGRPASAAGRPASSVPASSSDGVCLRERVLSPLPFLPMIMTTDTYARVGPAGPVTGIQLASLAALNKMGSSSNVLLPKNK